MNWQMILPDAAEIGSIDFSQAREIRLRPGQPLQALFPWGRWQGSHPLSPAEIARAAAALSGHTLAMHREALRQGYLPLPGGHRLGVAGVMGEEGLLEITSLCVRIAHEMRGVGDAVFPRIEGKSTLIIGPPGTGKTTLLRDLIRLYSLHGWQVGVADERGEIAACASGAPQLEIGAHCDVVSRMEKSRALMLLLRAMAPQVLAADELGGPRDAEAALEALRCGAVLLVTAHAGSAEALRRRPGMETLFSQGAFESVVTLKHLGGDMEIAEVGACGLQSR